MQDFLIQLVRRFLAETPAFHKVIRALGIITAVIAAVPQFLEAAGLMEILPNGAMDIISKVVIVSGLVASFIAQLATTEQAKEVAAKLGKPIK